MRIEEGEEKKKKKGVLQGNAGSKRAHKPFFDQLRNSDSGEGTS